MMKGKACLILIWVFACLLSQYSALAQSSVSLTGVVGSEAEGKMEGVVVSAKRVGGKITVSVVSNQDGRYSIPADRLAAGEYEIRIRATGYDAADPQMVASVTSGKETNADIKLNKTKDLPSQLMSSEWLMSIPGTQQQEKLLVKCMTFHDLTPIFKSSYNATGWETTLLRMWNWSQSSSFNKPLLSPNRESSRPGDEEFAKYLSTVNLSAKSTIDFEYKTLPRPHGSDTKVIITEYDLPRSDTEPHDATVSQDGSCGIATMRKGSSGGWTRARET